MGPAILLCPSSSSVQLWGQVLPLKKTRQKEGGISYLHSCLRCSANAHCTGDSRRRSPFFLHPVSSSEIYRRRSYPFRWRKVSAAASGGEVSVEEATIGFAEQGETSNPASGSKEETPVATEQAPAATERRTQARRSLNRSNSNANRAIVVSAAELLPGANFPGKVVSIQTFGAFVDMGAFTNGLIHISRLSKSYVKKVEDVVQVGQDVKVQVLEVDLQANRISLMLVEEGKEEAPQEGGAAEKSPPRAPQQPARTPRRDSSKRQPSQRQAVTTTMKKGEIATGTVKNIIRSGVFITMPDGVDGYLPTSEVIFKGPNTSMEANFQVGQELSVRVLRIDKGRINLTMKREVNFDKLNEDLNKGVVDGATNPFELAFRRNELIASFLADRDKRKAEAEATEEAKIEKADSSAEEVKDVAEASKAADSVEEVKAAAEVEKKEIEVKEEEKVAVDTLKDEVEPSEAADSVEEVKPVAEVEKKEVGEVKEEEKVAVDTPKDEGQPSGAVDSVEEVKAAAEVEKKEEEEKVAITTPKDKAEPSEAADSVEEVKAAAEVEKKEVKEEEKIAVHTPKDEAEPSEPIDSAEEVQGVAEVENPKVKDEEEKGFDAVDTLQDVAESSEAVDNTEEMKAAAELKKPAVEEREMIGVRAKEDEAEPSEAGEEGKAATAEMEKRVLEEEENIKNGVETVSSEAVRSVEEVQDKAEVEKPVVEKEDEKVISEDAVLKGESELSEATSSLEDVKEALEVEKPAAKQEDKEVADEIKDEVLSPEEDSVVEELKDTSEVEKPASDGKEEKGVSVNAAKVEAASSEASAKNVITLT